MITKKLLPKFLKDVLTHIPTIALKSVDWTGILREMGPLLFKLGSKDLEESKRENLSKLLNQYVEIIKKDEKEALSLLSKDEKINLGNNILRVYFLQLQNPSGLCLDLRSIHFSQQNKKVFFSPNNSWYQLDNQFRESLYQVYRGFYLNDHSLFKIGLKNLGLTKNLDPDKCNELEKLFHSHFGAGAQDLVKFELQNFSESFYKLFNFFIENKIELHKDFIFIGIYLVTLYMHLEELDEVFDVRSIFLEVSS